VETQQNSVHFKTMLDSRNLNFVLVIEFLIIISVSLKYLLRLSGEGQSLFYYFINPLASTVQASRAKLKEFL